MSIMGKDFQIQKQNISGDEIGKICSGINRIRFIKNRVANKGNFILHLLSTQSDISKAQQNEESQNFITTFLTLPTNRQPLSELRDAQEHKSKNTRQANLEKVIEIKQQKRELHQVAQARHRQDLMRKLENKRKLQKGYEHSKSKIKDFLAERNKSVKIFKRQLMQEKVKKIEAEAENLEIYENKVLLGERIKEIILSKFEKYRKQEQVAFQKC